MANTTIFSADQLKQFVEQHLPPDGSGDHAIVVGVDNTGGYAVAKMSFQSQLGQWSIEGGGKIGFNGDESFGLQLVDRW